MEQYWKLLSIRKMQAYASLCIAAYCSSKAIKHPAISELVYHLLSILTISDLGAWNENGTLLHITGRGDALPQDVEISIPKSDIDIFRNLVESAVEVGQIDLYAALSSEPAQYLEKCVNILKKEQIKPPQVEPVLVMGENSYGWGEPIDSNTYSELLKSYTEISTLCD